MPEGTEVPIKEKHKSLETQEYQLAKRRIEASKHIAQELKRDGHQMREQNPAVTEVNNIVREKSKPVSLADATEYEEQRIRMVYHSPDDTDSASEDLVFYLKSGEDGYPEMLEVNGKPLFLNAELCDADYSIPYQRWAKNINHHYQAVPQVDHNGAISEVVELHTSRPIDISNLEILKS